MDLCRISEGSISSLIVNHSNNFRSMFLDMLLFLLCKSAYALLSCNSYLA
jgi:hypothetical protein